MIIYKKKKYINILKMDYETFEEYYKNDLDNLAREIINYLDIKNKNNILDINNLEEDFPRHIYKYTSKYGRKNR